MSYAMRRILNQLPLPYGMRSDRRLRTAELKHAQFLSFLAREGFGSGPVDRHERSLRRRRIAKWMLLWGTAFFVAWVSLESLRALMVA